MGYNLWKLWAYYHYQIKLTPKLSILITEPIKIIKNMNCKRTITNYSNHLAKCLKSNIKPFSNNPMLKYFTKSSNFTAFSISHVLTQPLLGLTLWSKHSSLKALYRIFIRFTKIKRNFSTSNGHHQSGLGFQEYRPVSSAYSLEIDPRSSNPPLQSVFLTDLQRNHLRPYFSLYYWVVLLVLRGYTIYEFHVSIFLYFQKCLMILGYHCYWFTLLCGTFDFYIQGFSQEHYWSTIWFQAKIKISLLLYQKLWFFLDDYEGYCCRDFFKIVIDSLQIGLHQERKNQYCY